MFGGTLNQCAARFSAAVAREEIGVSGIEGLQFQCPGCKRFNVWGLGVYGHGMGPKIVSHRSTFFSAARGVAWSETAANLLKPLKGELVGPRNCLFLTHSRLQLPPVSLPLTGANTNFHMPNFSLGAHVHFPTSAMTHPPQAEIETEGSRKGPGPQISLRIAWHTGLGDQSRNSSGQFGVTKGDRKRASRGSIQASTVRHRNCVRSKNKRDEFAQDSNADRSGKKKTRLAGCLQADTTQVHCFSGCAANCTTHQQSFLLSASDS